MTPQKTAEIIQLPGNRDKTIQTVRKVKIAVDRKMAYLFDGLCINAADALFEEMYESDAAESLSQHFNITRALKVSAGVYQDEYFTLSNVGWVHVIKGRDKSALPAASDEIMALMKSYSDRNMNHYKILLEELRQRFSSLVGKDLKQHPMLPMNFYLCFWYATEKLELTDAERLLLVPVFNRFVMDRFGQVLSIANQTLVEMGIKCRKPEQP